MDRFWVTGGSQRTPALFTGLLGIYGQLGLLVTFPIIPGTARPAPPGLHEVPSVCLQHPEMSPVCLGQRAGACVEGTGRQGLCVPRRLLLLTGCASQSHQFALLSSGYSFHCAPELSVCSFSLKTHPFSFLCTPGLLPFSLASCSEELGHTLLPWYPQLSLMGMMLMVPVPDWGSGDRKPQVQPVGLTAVPLYIQLRVAVLKSIWDDGATAKCCLLGPGL